MNFDLLAHSTARQQLKLLGAAPALFYGANPLGVETIALVQRDVEVIIDDGRALTKKTVISLLKTDVTKVRRLDKIKVNPTDIDSHEEFIVGDILSDDGFIIDVYVRD